jgi:hypothetical protein
VAEAVGLLLIEALPGGVGLGASTSLSVAGLSVSASTLGSAAILAGSVALQFALAQKPASLKPGQNLISIRQPNPVRTGGYGRARVGGSYMLYDVDPTNAGLSVDVLALVSGRICGFGQVYLNEDAPTDTPTNGGLVAFGPQGTLINATANGSYSPPAVGIGWRAGLPTETWYGAIHPDWDSTHRGDGIASICMQCRQPPSLDDFTKRFPNGHPEPSVELDLYPIWDPRDGAQDPDDPETWCAYAPYDPTATYAAGDRVVFQKFTAPTPDTYNAGTTYARYAVVSYGGVVWFSRVAGNVGHTPGADLTKWLPIGAPYYSYADGNTGNRPDTSPAKWCSVLANPVLQMLDYLTNGDHGMGLDRGRLITPQLAALIAKANVCDELVLDKDGNYGPRYTSAGTFGFDDDPADVLNGIGATCDAWWCEDGEGALAFEVGKYVPPTVTLEPKHIVGLTVNFGTADDQVVNDLTLTFIDPANTYREAPGQDWRNEADISARGRLRSQALALKWVQRHSQARRLAKRAMARLSAPTGTVTLTLYGLLALGQRWVTLQYPAIAGLEEIVVELSRGRINHKAGTVTFDWLKVDPDTIDAWSPLTEEGDGPLGEVRLLDDASNPLMDDAAVRLENE